MGGPERRPDVKVVEMHDKVPTGTRRVQFSVRRTVFTLLIDGIRDDQKIITEGLSGRWYKRRVKKEREKFEKKKEVVSGVIYEKTDSFVDYPSVAEQALS